MNEIRDSELLPLAREAFNAGFDLNAGSGSPAAFKAAEKRFTPAVRALEKLMREMGEAIASGLPRKLYQDLAHMYRRMSAYDRADIIDWVDGMVEVKTGLDASDAVVVRGQTVLLDGARVSVRNFDGTPAVAAAENAAEAAQP